MKQLNELTSWMALEKHAESLRFLTPNDLSHNYPPIQLNQLSLDFSKQRINDNTIELLVDLANERHLKERVHALMFGSKVNESERRPALHTALRSFDATPIFVDGKDILPDILAVREQMHLLSSQIRQGDWLGYSGRPIQDIVNIGIGGSDFGPRFCINALADYTASHLGFHFVSDVDPRAFEHAVSKLDPETTLFIVSSKSFTTQETLYNTKKALRWLDRPQDLDRHFIAVTANIEKAKELGFSRVLPIWGWVGGRYSLCSAINLITCIAIGFEHFTELLIGANNMDKHYLKADLHENMPAMMGLLGIWNINALHHHSLLMLVYARQLELLVPYTQQLDMESNGKSIDRLGRAVNHATGPIVWGGLGNQAQHSYYQLLCQGTHKIAADFISLQEFNQEMIHSFCKAKMNVLSEGVLSENDPNGYIAGGVPVNHLRLKTCSPLNLGALVALYEHKIYTQSVLWNINPFDQPGVESAKRLKQISVPV
ncbi:MAG: glucose-6-phosphate isomerase [Tatlockia sp.]|jgi:glucose-6-phosphate isomerase